MNNSLLWLVVGLVVLAALSALMKRMGTGGGPRALEGALPYRRKDYLLSKAERSFYEVLRQALGESDVLVFAKVRLLDLLWLPKGTAKAQSLRNRVISKHVDFVLCDRRELRPLLVIELDDKSHDEEERQTRDAFVDRVLGAAGLPILHLSARWTYSTRELSEQVRAAISGAAVASGGRTR
ncbi:MAG TPA: DUF2726 domain-containing protein [Tepidisphaeraceae bacterium]|nr:DUF2726 domain-containing protein [Tepidisphaeraceae bacterium]